MDETRVDTVLRFCLAAASHEERGSRELGPIHLIKYVYLADLAYSKSHGGETFTGAPWRFHHFGPWALEVHQRIEPVARSMGANERTFGDFDTVRWSLHEDPSFDTLRRVLPFEVTSTIRNSIRRFADHTPELLHVVYQTAPMLHAKPGEPIDFSVAAVEPSPAQRAQGPVQLTAKQEKRRRERMHALKDRLRTKIRGKQRRMVEAWPPPRYDETFAAGLEWLDALAGDPIGATRGELQFSDAVWSAPGRGDGELP